MRLQKNPASGFTAYCHCVSRLPTKESADILVTHSVCGARRHGGRRKATLEFAFLAVRKRVSPSKLSDEGSHSEVERGPHGIGDTGRAGPKAFSANAAG